MLKSPLPGMDPYLELDWLDVHSALVTYIRDQLQEQLPGDLCARMESRVLVEDSENGGPQERHPDVQVAERTTWSRGGPTAVAEAPSEATAEPDMYLVQARG